MADTGENRQIVGRANAKEAETVRTSKRMVSAERSTEKTGNATFHSERMGSPRKSKTKQQQSPSPLSGKQMNGDNPGR
jgi:hypothetical protein